MAYAKDTNNKKKATFTSTTNRKPKNYITSGKGGYSKQGSKNTTTSATTGTNNYKNGKNRKPNLKPADTTKATTIYLTLKHNDNTPEHIMDELDKIVKTIPFDKVSFPLSVNRSIIDGEPVNLNENKVTTVGYICEYNAFTRKFRVILFDKIVKLPNYDKLNLTRIAPRYITNTDRSIKTITKFIAY